MGCKKNERRIPNVECSSRSQRIQYTYSSVFRESKASSCRISVRSPGASERMFGRVLLRLVDAACDPLVDGVRLAHVYAVADREEVCARRTDIQYWGSVGGRVDISLGLPLIK